MDRNSAEPDGVGVVLKIGGVTVQGSFDCCPESERSLSLVDRVKEAMPTCLVQQHRGGVGACIVDGDQPGGPGIQFGQCLQGRRQPTRRVKGDQNSCDVRCRDVDPIGLLVDVIRPRPRTLIEAEVLDTDRRQATPSPRASWPVLVGTGQGDVAIHQIL